MRALLRAAALSALVYAAACSPAEEPEPTDAPEVEPADPVPEAAADPAPEPAVAPEPEPEPVQAASTDGGDGLWPHDGSDLPPDPDVRYGRLDNGLRYAVLVNDTPTGTAAMRLRIDMGSLSEGDDQQGLAHFIEHMIFNGSENVPEGEMVRILERYGLAFGPDTNAYTSFDETVYQLDLPSVEEEVLDTAFFIMRESADRVLFEQSAIDAERGVILSEERFRNTYSLRYTRDLWEFLFPEATFPTRFPIGTVEVIEAAQRDRFVDLYDRYYTPERGFFVIVGDFDPAAIETAIEETFGDWTMPENPGEDPALGAVSERGLEAGFFSDPDMPTVVTFNVVSPAEIEPDTAEARRERLIRGLGASILNRRFQRLSRAVDAPFLQASAGFSQFYETADAASVQIVSRPEQWREALAVAEQELRRALEHGFGPVELAEQIANIRTSLENGAAQSGTRETPALADGIAAAFGSDTVFTHPDGALERFESYADDITPEMVHQAFRAEWAEREPLIHLATNTEVENAESLILEAYAASAATPVDAPAFAGSAAFAYTEFGAPGVVAERAVIEDLDVTTLRFENGVRLNVKSTDFEDEIIRASIRVGGGWLELPLDQPGLGFLVDNALSNGGLEAHSIDELQSVLAGRTVSFGMSANTDAFQMGASTSPDDFELQMQLFAALLTAPGYREEGVSQYRQLIEVWYETLDATPQSVASRDVPRLLRSGDPRFGIPSRETLLSPDFDDLRPALARAFTEGAIEIAVVGDVEVDTVVDVVSRTFGALPQRLPEPQPFDEARQVRFPETGGETVELNHAGEPNRALLQIYWPAEDDSDALRTRRLTLLREVMGLKLIERIREELGATYSPNATSSFSSVNPGYGYLGVSLDIEPEEIGSLIAVVDEIAAELSSGGVSEDELARARRPVLERLEERLENNRYWLGLIATAQSEPEYLERHRQAVEQYESVTPDELVALAETYLRPELAYRIAIVPTPEG